MSLVAETSAGLVGFHRILRPGVVVVRGANTMGKSLLVQSLLYGLGMDDLFTTRQGTLTRAMQSEIDIGPQRFPVIESTVEIEVSNGSRILTIRRFVHPPSGQATNAHQLVAVWEMAALTDGIALAQRGPANYFFVNRPGSAENERGFHPFLAEFLGWDLPKVVSYDDAERRLYIQLVFGLAYVEQKRGWGGTVPQVPTKYKIVEPLRRAVEFTLQLDILKQLMRRRALDEEIRRLESGEQLLRGRLEAAARSQGASLSLPRMPNRQARSADGAMEGVDLEKDLDFTVLRGDTWISIGERVEELEQKRVDRAMRAAESDRPASKPAAAAIEEQLSQAQQELDELGHRVTELNESETMLDIQRGALSRRLVVTEEERRRYGQIRTLVQLGAELAPSSLADGDCPTCHQSLIGVEAVEGNALSVDASHTMLGQERSTVLSMIAQVETAIASHEPTRLALTKRMSELRAQVRAYRNDLTSPDVQPSLAELQSAMTDEENLRSLLRFQEDTILDRNAWKDARRSLAELILERIAIGNVELSASDQNKMNRWVSLLRHDLASFGFVSARPEEVGLDEGMRPIVDGYDIGFQGSASDGIRLRWAYLLSLWHTCMDFQGKHPGFLILDEPDQQGVEPQALTALCTLAQDISAYGQVILTTSERPEAISRWFAGKEYTLVDLGVDRLLMPLG